MALTAKKVYAILKRQISDMEAKLNSPVRYRGTVATADLLPLNPDIGDMYNIESKSVYGEAGMNVAWNGVVWDTMGAPIDMSLYIKSSELADWVKQQNKPAYTAEEVGALPADTKIPSKTSDLQNDSGFLTEIPDNYLSGTDKTLSVSGKAADAKATGEKIAKNSSDITKKLDKNQGVENSGKIAGINESGDIVPMFPVGVEYNPETNCLEFGSDQKMELNQGIGLDSTLTNTGSAADAGATGKEINSLKEEIEKSAIRDYTKIDYHFVKNGKLVCNNSNPTSSGAVAKYTKANMGSNIVKAMCLFSARNGGNVTLISTPLDTDNNVQNIVNKSIHCIFGMSSCVAQTFLNGTAKTLGTITYPTLNNDDTTEYECGFEIINNNTLRLYAPNGETLDCTGDWSEYNGKFFIYEEYNGKPNIGDTTSEWERPSIIAVFCKPTNGHCLRDEFKNYPSGYIPCVAPSGHVYTNFRNVAADDNKYVNANGTHDN